MATFLDTIRWTVKYSPEPLHGLIEHILSAPSPFLAAAACQRDDIDRDLRIKLGRLAAESPTPDEETVAAVGRWVAETIEAGEPPDTVLTTLLATPAGAAATVEVLMEAMRWSRDVEDQLEQALATSTDQRLILCAAHCVSDPHRLLEHWAALWGQTRRRALRWALVEAGGITIPALYRRRGRRAAAWLATFASPELMARWVLAPDYGQDGVPELRAEVGRLVLPAYLADQTIMPARLAAQLAGYHRDWPDAFVADLADRASRLGLSPKSTFSVAAKELAATAKWQSSGAWARDAANRGLGWVTDFEARSTAAWVSANVPDDPDWWATLCAVGPQVAANPEQSTATVVEIVRGMM